MMNQNNYGSKKVSMGTLLDSKSTNLKENSVTLHSKMDSDVFERPKRMPKLQ